MRSLSIPLLVLLFASGGAHATDTVQAADREAGLMLLRQTDGWVVQRPGGEATPLPLGDGFQPFALESLSDGWLLTGSVAAGPRRDLVVLRGGPHQRGPQRVETLPQPGGRLGPKRGNPVAFVDNGRLRGLAWVEGRTQEDLMVRAAEWLGSDWGPAEEISPGAASTPATATPVRGAQLALTAAVLSGGDWLLLWAGFDGEDDEILWSRRSERVWSAPRRLHDDNRVPDVTPTVVATDGGALAAWSTFHQGDYRLRVARLEDGVWNLTPPSGGRGSLDPQALTAPGKLLILHRTVIPDGWTLLEFDRGGAPLRRGSVPVATADRPVVVSTGDGELALFWPSSGGGETVLLQTPSWGAPEWEEPR